MILQALYQYYQRLLQDPESGVAPPKHSLVGVSFAVVIDNAGHLLDLIDLRSDDKPLRMLVPEHKRRSGKNPEPYFLCDNAKYFLGISDKPEEGEQRFNQFRELHLRLLEGIDRLEANAVVSFLQTWEPGDWQSYKFLAEREKELLKGANVVFQIDGQRGFVHESDWMDSIWLSTEQTDSSAKGQCLITGQEASIARIHAVAIKGVVGAQPAGAALVSFNIESFASYGKTQSFNAPVSEAAAFAYAIALNYLLADSKHRIRLGDTTAVFWAERETGGPEEDWLAYLLNPTGDEEAKGESAGGMWRIDHQARQQIMDILQRCRDGLPITTGAADFDPEVRFYLLGLSPNNSRIAVRFWHVESFGSLLNRLGQHYTDLSIAGLDAETGLLPSWRILSETAVQGKRENIPPLLGGALLRAILTGQAYPQSLYTAMLARIRSGGKEGRINAVRAGVIKACLLRRARILGETEKEGLYTVSLNESSTNPAYRLGRLFALLEKAQQDAVPGANATIRDRYFGAASATPGAVFPLLLRLSRHHIAKAEYGEWTDRRIQEVMSGLDSFPNHLNLEEQGLFVLGYYHQREAMYQKRGKRDEE